MTTMMAAGALVGGLTWQGIERMLQRYGAPAWTRRRVWGLFFLLGFALLGGYEGRTRADFEAINVLVVTGWLVGVALIDGLTSRIPNIWLAGITVWAFVQMAVTGRPPWYDGVLAAFTLGGVFALLAWLGKGALGMGDVKFVSALGLLMGTRHAWQGVILGVLLGGGLILLLLGTGKIGRKDFVPYGPNLALGAWIVFMLTVHGRIP